MTRPSLARRSAPWTAALRRAALLLAVAAPAAAAQQLRSVEFARQLHDTLPLGVQLDYAAGKIVVHSGEPALLYQMLLSYDPRHSEPVYRYDQGARQLRVGARRAGEEVSGSQAPELRLDLSRAVPVDLSMEIGAAEADLDLGGMRLRSLSLESGASDAVVHFDAPNLIPMSRLALDVGAASLRARGLANSRARALRVQVGVGTAELDFGGDWTSDMELDLEVALGKATLRVPEDVGVRVETSRFLTSFDRDGFVKRGDAYYSTNWDTARRKLHVRSRMTLGQLEVLRGAG